MVISTHLSLVHVAVGVGVGGVGVGGGGGVQRAEKGENVQLI
jgi:hypothetical protein